MVESVSEFSPEVVTPNEILERYNQHPTSLLQTYEYFTQLGDFAKQAKADFIEAAKAGNTPPSPGFAYPKIDIEELMTWRNDLADMLLSISVSDLDNEANRLIRENITTRLAEVGIMLLTKIQSQTDRSDPTYKTISWQLKQNMREVYGAPAKEDWLPIMGLRLKEIEEALDKSADTPPEVVAAAEYLRDRLPQDLPVGEIYQPKPETVSWYRRHLIARTAVARAAVRQAVEKGEVILDEEGRLDCDNAVLATKVALKAHGYARWDSKPTDGTNLETSQVDLTIYIPRQRQKGPMNLDDFDQFVEAHEIDKHVATRESGDASGEPVLGGLGCTDYMQWEEGNGKANEALITGVPDLKDSAYDHFLRGGLIMGLDREGNERFFGEVFDIAWRLILVDDFTKGKVEDIEEAKNKAMSDAFDKVRRLFRGTDGLEPGVYYSKDSVNYYPGQVTVWRKWDKDMAELDEEARILEHDLERAAKINPLRADHRRVVIRAMLAKQKAQP